MAAEHYGSPEAESTSQQRIHVCPITQLLNRFFDDLPLKGPEVKLTANWLERRLHVIQLMLRWKSGLGGEQVANREFGPDLLLFLCEVVPRDDSSRENSAGRVGSDALSSQGRFSYHLNSKIERVAGLEILLKGLWL